MTLQKLTQYKGIKAEISSIRSRLDVITLKSPKLDGLPSGTDVTSPTENAALRLAELSELYSHRLEELYVLEKEINDFVEGIKDIELATYVREKYIEGRYTRDTTACAQFHYDRTTMQKRLRRYIKKENSLR